MKIPKLEHIGLGLILISAMTIGTAWWNIDYTFGVFISKIGSDVVIGVPFLGSFTSGEWWNINAILLMIGIILAGMGGYVVGYARE